jgi:hypothetical protein
MTQNSYRTHHKEDCMGTRYARVCSFGRTRRMKSDSRMSCWLFLIIDKEEYMLREN